MSLLIFYAQGIDRRLHREDEDDQTGPTFDDLARGITNLNLARARGDSDGTENQQEVHKEFHHFLPSVCMVLIVKICSQAIGKSKLALSKHDPEFSERQQQV